jgi:hypothetical protein
MGRPKRQTRAATKLDLVEKKRRTGEGPKLSKNHRNFVFAEKGNFFEEIAIGSMGGTVLHFENMKT